MDGPCTSLPSKGKTSLPGKPLPKAHWTGTCSLSPSTPGPQGSDTQPPGVGLQPPAPGEGQASQDGEGADGASLGEEMGSSRRAHLAQMQVCVAEEIWVVLPY